MSNEHEKRLTATVSPNTAIMLSTFCVYCDLDKEQDGRARFIYKGDSVCEKHLAELRKKVEAL